MVRLKGEMTDSDVAGLSACMFTGTNIYKLNTQGWQRDLIHHSLICCWAMDSLPVTNARLEFRVCFAWGAEVTRIAVRTDREEFARPLVGPGERKRHVADILGGFVEGKTPAESTLKTLHGLYEEYGAPDFLAAFEMLYYDQDGSTAGTTENFAHRLKSVRYSSIDSPNCLIAAALFFRTRSH